jgi:hypothetical protein
MIFARCVLAWLVGGARDARRGNEDGGNVHEWKARGAPPLPASPRTHRVQVSRTLR